MKLRRLPALVGGSRACVLLLFFPVLLGTGVAQAQEEGTLDADDASSKKEPAPVSPPLAEGPLANDAFLPLDAGAVDALARADKKLAAARAEAREEARARLLDEAFEALAQVAARWDPAGDGVPLDPTAEGAPRLVQGQGDALRARIGGLAPAERARWRERFEAVAAIQAERDPALARAWPGTRAAARGWLYVTDRALEEGRNAMAASALRAARAAAALADLRAEGGGALTADAFESALAQRARYRAQLFAALDAPPAFDSATRLAATGVLPLSDTVVPLVPAQAEAGRGVRPGAVALDARTLLVQTAERLVRVPFDASGAPLTPTALELERIVADAFGSLPRPRVGLEPPGWPLRPLLHEGELLLVVGARGPEPGATPNALVRVAPPTRHAPGGRPSRGLLTPRPGDPRPAWVLSGDLLWRPGSGASDPGGTLERQALLAPLADAEWQPGIALVDDLLLAQARVAGDRTSLWLVALEARTAAPRWIRRLGAGTGYEGAQTRFSAAAAPRQAAPALLAAEGLVLAPSLVGLQSLVDARDGSLVYSLATRRLPHAAGRPAAPRSAGWSLPGPFLGAPSSPDVPTALLAPPDSDRLYHLTLAPLASAASAPGGGLPFASPPRAIESAQALVGGEGATVLVLRRDGRERTLSALADPAGLPTDAFHLSPGEVFRGRGAVSPARVLLATNRALYLLDRGRDLALLDAVPLQAAGRLSGGDVFVFGERIVVLGFDALWSFRAAP